MHRTIKSHDINHPEPFPVPLVLNYQHNQCPISKSPHSTFDICLLLHLMLKILYSGYLVPNFSERDSHLGHCRSCTICLVSRALLPFRTWLLFSSCPTEGKKFLMIPTPLIQFPSSQSCSKHLTPSPDTRQERLRYSTMDTKHNPTLPRRYTPLQPHLTLKLGNPTTSFLSALPNPCLPALPNIRCVTLSSKMTKHCSFPITSPPFFARRFIFVLPTHTSRYYHSPQTLGLGT
ncbi:hypothetical protein V8F06_001129 [Rhypophila decipiens]